jgi:hypothetical protein
VIVSSRSSVKATLARTEEAAPLGSMRRALLTIAVGRYGVPAVVAVVVTTYAEKHVNDTLGPETR